MLQQQVALGFVDLDNDLFRARAGQKARRMAALEYGHNQAATTVNESQEARGSALALDNRDLRR